MENLHKQMDKTTIKLLFSLKDDLNIRFCQKATPQVFLKFLIYRCVEAKIPSWRYDEKCRIIHPEVVLSI